MSTNEILLTIKIHRQIFVDPKRIRLLKAINETGSINQGAKLAQVSYKSAWDHLEIMNNISPKPLLERNTGGVKGGGTKLTTYAHRLLKLYQLLEDTQNTAFEILQKEDIPLDSPLFATSLFSLQSSARNQFFGHVNTLRKEKSHYYVAINIAGLKKQLFACITLRSAERLQLFLNKEVMFMVKVPSIHIHKLPIDVHYNQFQAVVKSIHDQEVILEFGENEKLVECIAEFSEERYQIGDSVYFTIDPEQIIVASLP